MERRALISALDKSVASIAAIASANEGACRGTRTATDARASRAAAAPDFIRRTSPDYRIVRTRYETRIFLQ
jgi:hypothetical protein